MKKFSYYFMTLVLGIILGYSWCVYHRPLVCFEIERTDWYKEKIESYVAPPLITKVKHRNRLLRQKSNG